MADLQIHYPDGRKAVVELAAPEVVIGRDSSVDITIEDHATSRRHARLYRDTQGRFWVQDLHSKNGTLLNGQIVGTARVRGGDRLQIGGCCLTLLAEPQVSVVVSNGQATSTGEGNAWRASQRLELPRMRLEKLYELNERLTGRFDRDDLLGEVLDMCVETLRFERAGIAVWAGGGRPEEWVRTRDLRSGPADELRISRSVLDRALRRAERVLINDTAEVDPTRSMISNNIRSAMCVPMEYQQEVRGVIYGDRVTSTGGYTREDIDFFAALGRLGAMGLVNVRLLEEISYRKQTELQLQWGRQIQTHLFPAEPLIRPGLLIDALNDPGQKVSGDYYDYFVRPDGRIAVVIADVSGKGVSASLLMANLQAAVQLTLGERAELLDTVRVINRLVCRNVGDCRFITAILGLLDPEAHTFTCVNAGHQRPFVLGSGGAVRKHDGTGSGIPLGIETDFVYQSAVIDLSARPTTLFLYTDGITEAENPEKEMFEERRLVEALRASADLPPNELLAAVRGRVRQFTRDFTQNDDITMIVLRCDTEVAPAPHR